MPPRSGVRNRAFLWWKGLCLDSTERSLKWSSKRIKKRCDVTTRHAHLYQNQTRNNSKSSGHLGSLLTYGLVSGIRWWAWLCVELVANWISLFPCVPDLPHLGPDRQAGHIEHWQRSVAEYWGNREHSKELLGCVCGGHPHDEADDNRE